jgi:hypothetical protein
MKTTLISNWRPLLRAFCRFLIAIAALLGVPKNTQAQLYVLQNNPSQIGIVSEYSTKGELINADFITGLSDPVQIAVSGNALFVTNNLGGTVGKYDATTGGAINAGFITGLVVPYALAVSGNSLFVASYFHTGNDYIIGKYDAITGAAINASFITVLSFPTQIAVLGNKLFVSTETPENGTAVYTVGKYDANTGALIKAKFIKGLNLLAGKGNTNTLFGLDDRNTVVEYDATTGTAINPSFITGLKGPISLALLGNRVFVAKYLKDTVADYDATTGALINARFITGTMPYPISIAVKRTK